MTVKTATSPNGAVPHLENGERTDQGTFHNWYKSMPAGFKAELIGGEVVVASPLKINHAEHHALAMTWLGTYAIETPGTRVRDNGTAIIDDDREWQPDGALVIDPALGGQTGVNEEGYATGGAELNLEIAASSGSIDLHRKKHDYERAKVQEYIVVLLREQEVRWFVLNEGRFKQLPALPDGIFRSAAFPGLWLDAAALLRQDGRALLATLRQGLGTEEHKAFEQDLARRKT